MCGVSSLKFQSFGHFYRLVFQANDLQGVRAYSTLDTEKLYTLGMVIVDYRGYRVTAQSIIPGILEREQEQSVVYGSVDFGKTVVSSTKYEELLEESAKQLKIYPHMVKSGKEDVSDVKLYSSFETKVFFSFQLFFVRVADSKLISGHYWQRFKTLHSWFVADVSTGRQLLRRGRSHWYLHSQWLSSQVRPQVGVPSSGAHRSFCWVSYLWVVVYIIVWQYFSCQFELFDVTFPLKQNQAGAYFSKPAINKNSVPRKTSTIYNITLY